MYTEDDTRPVYRNYSLKAPTPRLNELFDVKEVR